MENKSSHGSKKDGENQLDLERIKSLLIKDEKLNSSRIATSPPKMINNTSIASNSSNSFSKSGDFETFDTQDRELLDILEELGNVEKAKEDDVNVTSLGRLRGHFCSDTIFNLSHRVLSNAEIKILEKGLDFTPIQRRINEPELRDDFEEFCRRMRVKWYFRNEPSESFSNKPAFSPKSNWKPTIMCSQLILYFACLFIYYYFQSTITFIVYYFYSSLDLFIHLFVYLILLSLLFYLLLLLFYLFIYFFSTI